MDSYRNRQVLPLFVFFVLITASQAIPCNSTESLSNVACHTNQTNGLEYVVCECLPGYELQGPTSVAVCLETGQGWGETMPNCTAIRCLAPDSPAGSIVTPAHDSYITGGTITYTCLEGFSGDEDPTRRCLPDGTWSETNFRCLPCSATGLLYDSQSCFIPVENGVSWSEAQSSCNANGWSLAKVENSEEQTFLFSQIDSREHWIGGKEATNWIWESSQMPIEYFTLADGEQNIVDNEGCLYLSALPDRSDLQWNDINCGSSVNPRMMYSICQFGELVKDTFWKDDQPGCDPSFPSGQDVKCIEMNFNLQQMDNWQCISCENQQRYYICRSDARNITTCGDPGVPLHGTRSELEYGTFNTSDIIQFMCEEGYKLTGSESRECLANGTWSGLPTTCNIITCEEPTPTANGNVTVLSAEYRGLAILSCAEGYEIDGEALIVCMSNGLWTSPNSTCVEVRVTSPEYLTTSSEVTAVVSTSKAASTTTQPTSYSSATSVELTTLQLTSRPDTGVSTSITDHSGGTTPETSNPTTQGVATVPTLSTGKPISTSYATTPSAHLTPVESTAPHSTTAPPQATTRVKPLSTHHVTEVATTLPSISRTMSESLTTSEDAITIVSTDAGSPDDEATLGSTELLIIITVSSILGLILLIFLLITICWCCSCRKDKKHLERYKASVALANKPANLETETVPPDVIGDLVVSAWPRSSFFDVRSGPPTVDNDYHGLGGDYAEPDYSTILPRASVRHESSSSAYQVPQFPAYARALFRPEMSRGRSLQQALVEEIELEKHVYQGAINGAQSESGDDEALESHSFGQAELFVVPSEEKSDALGYAKVELNRGGSHLSYPSHHA
ncbi:sushi, von Willebrand factor type A, EGF and pentraxin domain-containing protein 1-like isoform X2 [Acanthaster planci]|uniref:Sushi, von Willebrand factor type A, EGF and pentraxin domain-containing protein 1-like isoform X2 n=1 Tax=Acanthaster planci TaxID=133434 RepID=A0A8B7Y967_ACAPL|nr:sushi, von Willebrand factor type A, EGF and pentraxin domain-containing protein 1-like isoform X2 [Acanthaster planci]